MKKTKQAQVRKTVQRSAQGSKPKRTHSSGVGRPHMNTAEVKGLFSPFGGGGAFGTPGGAEGAGAADAARALGSEGGFLSMFNRVGGLDGILSTMGKMQKLFTIMRQMGPIFKLMGSFGGLGTANVKMAALRGKPTPKRKKDARLKQPR
ncbi:MULTISPECIES: hypothetical protein [unclassified Paenibacillus]|uniref:hypothetical protein n=1 Tax=unclassified Paenibacillus TaxID=185978 RepID=UPI001AE76918|nr:MULTISPECIES: hypothetical protein [unclassified Paenibacillus]MBP1156722.1 hypothetical protein [Paenibacillus sp. PvP091]MBP1172540.1 hypothetical protein [Paenibacillus sp. PvR098]MBP2438920.1 hypothetical protein [Paenibacillus sp. PvP052]